MGPGSLPAHTHNSIALCKRQKVRVEFEFFNLITTVLFTYGLLFIGIVADNQFTSFTNFDRFPLARYIIILGKFEIRYSTELHQTGTHHALTATLLYTLGVVRCGRRMIGTLQTR